MEINHLIEDVQGPFNTDESGLVCVVKPKDASVRLCFDAGVWKIPFAAIKLYTRDRWVDARDTFDDASKLGEEIARRWNAGALPALAERDLHHHGKGAEEARAGLHEVFLREDGEDGVVAENSEMPVCRFEWWHDSGDASVGMPPSCGWQLAADQSGTLLEVVIKDQEKIAKAIETLELIDKLREDEGHSVMLMNDAADFGVPNAAIDCMGDWTGWVEKRFEGDSVLDCLRAAVQEMGKGIVPVAVEVPEEMTVAEVKGCARCGGDHGATRFSRLTRQSGKETHWASCPTLGEPILMQLIQTQDHS